MTSEAGNSAPFLTIVVTGRNDDFGGDFNGRFIRALRFNHAQLSAAGVSHEFVFVEWAPIEKRPHLASVLREELRDLVGAELRSFVVDRAYHEALTLNPRLQFHEFIAKNVGIRRARGQFVLTTNTDIYLSRGVVNRLAAGTFETGVLYRAARHDLKAHIDVTWASWELLEDPRNCEIVNTIHPPCFTNASGDFLLLDTISYHRLRGFNEVYRTAKIHIDGNFCVKAHATGLILEDIGPPVYHVGRGTLHAQVGSYRENPGDAPWGDIRWKSDVVYVNTPGWGLGSAPERRLDSQSSFLEFDWNAIGPMVHLKGVVSPATRKEIA